MDIPRGIGYVIAILIIILGIVVLPYGIVLVFAAVLMIWAVYTGGKKKSLKAFMRRVKADLGRCYLYLSR